MWEWQSWIYQRISKQTCQQRSSKSYNYHDPNFILFIETARTVTARICFPSKPSTKTILHDTSNHLNKNHATITCRLTRTNPLTFHGNRKDSSINNPYTLPYIQKHAYGTNIKNTRYMQADSYTHIIHILLSFHIKTIAMDACQKENSFIPESIYKPDTK